MKLPLTSKHLVIIAAMIAVPSFCYLVVKASDAKIQFLLGLAAVGACGYVVGWIQDSPVSKREIEILHQTIQNLEEHNRSLKDLLTKSLVESRLTERASAATLASAATERLNASVREPVDQPNRARQRNYFRLWWMGQGGSAGPRSSKPTIHGELEAPIAHESADEEPGEAEPLERLG